jgi:hypothetical protein
MAAIAARAAESASDSRPTGSAIEASLTGKALVEWRSLGNAKKAVTLEILSDGVFGLPSEAAAMQQKYPELEVTTERANALIEPTLLAATTRTTWVRQNWTIFGITYTEVKTTMGYTTSNGMVTDVNRCYGSYVNYVPLRSISSNSWYTLGNGLADCWTEWTLGRPLQPTVTGIQGLRVDGWGKILKVWEV